MRRAAEQVEVEERRAEGIVPVDAAGDVIGVDMLRALSDRELAEAAAEESAEPQIGQRLRVEPEGHASI